MISWKYNIGVTIVINKMFRRERIMKMGFMKIKVVSSPTKSKMARARIMRYFILIPFIFLFLLL